MAGIDLGTCNSAVAYIKDGKPTVIKPNLLSAVLPSVVFIDKRGNSVVGHEARRCMATLDEEEGTGYGRWKPRMGLDDRFHFPAAKTTKTAPELSALVIRQLRIAYQRETGSDLRHCVITIPAKFKQAGNDATREAAKLAGVEYFETLKEPIAAALAYGFSHSDSRANWMVFDLGAGTLDVCLMVVRDGELSVLKGGQTGDQHLGGTNFDRELLDFVLGPKSNDRLKLDYYQKLQSDYSPLRQRYKLDDFSEKTQRLAFNQLLLAVEDAKIELSRKDEAVVHLEAPLCTDEAGANVDVDVLVTRSAYEKLISAEVERAVHICQTVLRNNHLQGKNIDQVILIGGPTKTPYIQHVLADRLGISLEVRVDPMTAVAEGAALKAETIDLPDLLLQAAPRAGTVAIDLKYDRKSQQPSCTVAGEVSGTGGGGLTVEISRSDGAWTSGPLPVDDSGFFVADLRLVEMGRPVQSVFTTTVLDAQGTVLARVDEPKIWYPFQDVGATLTNTISVAITGNATIVLLHQGETLPARAKARLKTTQPVRRGSSDDMLRIPLIEATTNLLGHEDKDHADAHQKIGELSVAGNHSRLTVDLPKGTEIELSLSVDRSQEITVVAYIDRVGDEFEAKLKMEPETFSIADLEVRFAREQHRLEQVRKLAQQGATEPVAAALAAIDQQGTLERIATELERAKQGERAAHVRAFERILELAGTLNHCWEEQTYLRLQDQVAQLKKGAGGEELRDAEKLATALQQAGPQANQASLRQLAGEIEDLDIKVRHRPFYTLLVYLSALSGLRVNADQAAAFKDADQLAEEIIGKGAPEALTSADLKRIEAANQKIRQVYPDLQRQVQEWEKNNPSRTSLMDSYGSTVTR